LRVNNFFLLGEVIDLQPLKRGVSGRVVKLKILGQQGEVVLSGLKIRSILGLRENLFIIERKTSPEGSIEAFSFVGKGWGHGVGLCQVGAFGMARKGATYQDILHHYYSGVALTKAY
jgi:Sporulation protein and related proteins